MPPEPTERGPLIEAPFLHNESDWVDPCHGTPRRNRCSRSLVAGKLSVLRVENRSAPDRLPRLALGQA
jgi:hypothetical protein